jgi:hypothetical protein
MGAPALPLVGDILSHTLSPLISRAIWPLMMAKIFGPRSVPGKFGATGLPVKNPGERARVTSISSSQPAIGAMGHKVSAT